MNAPASTVPNATTDPIHRRLHAPCKSKAKKNTKSSIFKIRALRKSDAVNASSTWYTGKGTLKANDLGNRPQI